MNSKLAIQLTLLMLSLRTLIVSCKQIRTDIERTLIANLFKDYDKNLKPCDSVEIKFSLNLNQIITLIEQEQILVINVYIDHEWMDPRLAWSPDEYQNITLLRVNSDLFWSPDTFG